MYFCPGKLILLLLARIDDWYQNLSEKTEQQLFNKTTIALKATNDIIVQ